MGADPNNHLLHSYPSRDDTLTSGESELSDDAIWMPPEAADDMEDDGTTSDDTTTQEDEEEDSGDGDGSFSWCQHQPTSSNANAAYSYYREERQKAMLRAMNGQLKMLAARFLESAGIPAALHQLQGADTCCWLDIVTSLSWEAALLIRPDATAGNEMDPSSYVKVKCLASGTRSQWYKHIHPIPTLVLINSVHANTYDDDDVSVCLSVCLSVFPCIQ